MSENSKIEWTDHTFNPWIGCTKVSPGCEHCYADTQDRFRKWTPEGWGKGKPRKLTSEANWREPVRWNRKALADYDRANPWEQTGPSVTVARPRVFCASLADWLDDEVPIEWLTRLLKLIFETPHLDWLLLTKRPGNWNSQLVAVKEHIRSGIGGFKVGFYVWLCDWIAGTAFPSHVWIGTTVEDQTRADERIPQLLSIPAKVRFLSCEPLLGPVNVCVWLPWNSKHQAKGLPAVLAHQIRMTKDIPGIDWVICGGESGPQARPMHPDWARSLSAQCKMAGVAFFMKQMGGIRNKRGTLEDMPEDLRFREVPHAT